MKDLTERMDYCWEDDDDQNMVTSGSGFEPPACLLMSSTRWMQMIDQMRLGATNAHSYAGWAAGDETYQESLSSS